MSVKKKSNSQKELDKAIDEIPGLILEEIGRKYAKEHPEEFQDAVHQTHRQKKQSRIYTPPHRSKTWLWVGVSIFTIAILAMWGLNISTMLYENGVTDDPLLSQLKKSQQDFGAIINTFGDDPNSIQDATSTQEVAGEKATSTDNLEMKIQNALGSLFTTTTTVTSTEISTTTIE